jgi:hypothetical protein
MAEKRLIKAQDCEAPSLASQSLAAPLKSLVLEKGFNQSFTKTLDLMAAEQYLAQRYEADPSAAMPGDETFIEHWEAWVNDPSGSPSP